LTGLSVKENECSATGENKVPRIRTPYRVLPVTYRARAAAKLMNRDSERTAAAHIEGDLFGVR
jgi:hypothetical protein